MKTENKIVELTFNFSLNIIQLYKTLIEQREFIVAKQLLRSGTSIGANVEEALAGQSRKDFISKLSISLKEARESRYWLKLLDKSRLVNLDYTNYLISIEHIINILTKIIKTSQGLT